MKVCFTPSARAQFLSALSDIRRAQPSAAVDFRNRAENIPLRLEGFAESGKAIPEFRELPHREVIVPPYRFFHKITGDIVWIVAVWHIARLSRDPAP